MEVRIFKFKNVGYVLKNFLFFFMGLKFPISINYFILCFVLLKTEISSIQFIKNSIFTQHHSKISSFYPTARKIFRHGSECCQSNQNMFFCQDIQRRGHLTLLLQHSLFSIFFFRGKEIVDKYLLNKQKKSIARQTQRQIF